MPKQYKSDALAAVHETAMELADAGVMAKQTMKAFDDMCLTPVEDLTADQIREIRLREKASQAVFARYLNVTTGLVSQHWVDADSKIPTIRPFATQMLADNRIGDRDEGAVWAVPTLDLGLPA